MGLFVHIAFTMEVWFHLLPPHEYVCLALGQQPEESPGSLGFVYLSHGAPVLPSAPDSATEEEKADRCQAGVWLVHHQYMDSKKVTEEQRPL